jgi:tetratricopeptide (TPR) repeat protein
MTGKECKEEQAKIQALRAQSDYSQARALTVALIEQLFVEQKFRKIVELYHSDLCEPRESFYTFEIAYALSETEHLDEAESMYEDLLKYEANNTAILNNLSHIKHLKNRISEAFDLIRRAYELGPQDKIIASNYHHLLAITQEKEAIQKKYTEALALLAHEKDVMIETLRIFLTNLTQEPEYCDYHVPIPTWKLGFLMEIPEDQSELVLADWLKKGYLRSTRTRDKQLAPIYEVNPYLARELEKIEPKQIPLKWVQGLEELTIENLERFSYFSLRRKIRKIDEKYRGIAERDLNELFFNYLMKNEKAVIVLAGSLVEVVLLYYCEKNDITTIYRQRKNNRTEKRDLYECDLAEILFYLQEKKMLGDIFVHVGNIARIYRNYIHPGKELRESEMLGQSKSDLCFVSTIEILNALL